MEEKQWLIEKREQNQTLVHKFDDHLTDIGRGYKLNIDEEWKNNG